ncbi:Hypothetical protein CFH99_0105 [Nocardioides aromaticivorans]|uniref:Uncharacterized protein n=1 Tax=Nocardioides aromaticivorans TaxID=200618 RepID=A0ABX7PT69_9ACTN|nr:hypothetical protein [Nocardioides aromaticivorans]QSR28897.1 Hypothetical protein CFH99_0105 [Nocardioides aromaticivorans]
MAPPTWKRYRPDPTPDGEPEPGTPTSPRIKAYQPPKQPKPVRSLEERTVRRRGWKLPAAGAVVLGLVVWGVVAIFRGVTAPDEPQTVEGYAAMLDDLREETGGTQAFRAVLYPGYAVVDVPYADDERSLSYYWDGGLDDPSKGTSTETPFDLSALEPTDFAGMCEAVRRTVEDPETCYLILERPDEPDGGWISAYTSNEFGQSSYIVFDLDGTEVSRYPAE